MLLWKYQPVFFEINVPTRFKISGFVYKYKSKNPKDNYRPVSMLSNISKIYERCLYDQIQVFFDSILSKSQWGVQRDYNAQHCLIPLIE